MASVVRDHDDVVQVRRSAVSYKPYWTTSYDAIELIGTMAEHSQIVATNIEMEEASQMAASLNAIEDVMET
jgi:hypothetical protein